MEKQKDPAASLSNATADHATETSGDAMISGWFRSSHPDPALVGTFGMQWTATGLSNNKNRSGMARGIVDFKVQEFARGDIVDVKVQEFYNATPSSTSPKKKNLVVQMQPRECLGTELILDHHQRGVWTNTIYLYGKRGILHTL